MSIKFVECGWILIDNNKMIVDFKPKWLDMFGCVIEQEPYEAEYLSKMDMEWPGRAPHACVIAYQEQKDD